MTPLPHGLVLRTATPGDLPQIAELLVDRGEPADAVDFRLMLRDLGLESCAVVVDGDRVVSTATLLDETLHLGEVALPAGQVDLVATDRAYEGRGLVRALMNWAHERSAARGDLVQIMIGIPYFYRQFGYAYAVPIVPTRPVTGLPDDDGAHTVRVAGAADIPAMAALQDAAQADADLRMPHSAACWRWLVERDGSSQLLVERNGSAVATGRITPPDEGVHLGQVAAVDPAAARALLRYAVLAGGESTVEASPRAFAAAALADYLGPPPQRPELYYLRVPDTIALLERLRPVLGARLAASAFADAEGEAIVSFFRSHVRLPYRAGVVGPVRNGGVMQAPGSQGGAAVAPDLVAALLFGPDGLAGLARRHPDAYPGPQTELMSTLFPPVSADILTYYLP
ncbi:putative N-acetyltransferase YhbS [Allocatelliglobosispora scoriae]|uniref:Putative N-acetyltransferase YhbS n=1 Tax=Allocatelliglobosispora scoriae TaxID=643052 RepID=A0A841C051_9ACTN|nr:GNAT family N-acetyltransferase [Allocatelliglobosispora scoriae]MBB5872523.1 putative N-acetyltransferase YhbS [Allocatelliglobosispora scoriae]